MSINARMTWNEDAVIPVYSWFAEAFDTETGKDFLSFGANPEDAMSLLTEQVRKHVYDGCTHTEYTYNYETGEFE